MKLLASGDGRPKPQWMACLSALCVAVVALALLSPRVLPLYHPSEVFHASVLLAGLFSGWIYRNKINWRLVRPAVVTGVVVTGVFLWQADELMARSTGSSVRLSDTLIRLALACSCGLIYVALSRGLTSVLRVLPGTGKIIDSPRGLWLRSLRALVALAIVGPYCFSALNAHRSKIPDSTDPMRACGLPYEKVSFVSDGIPISAWFVPRAGKTLPVRDQRTVIVCHGIGANKGMFLGLTPYLHRAGFNVLYFDFRGHGDSSGHTVTFGHDEARDVVAAGHYLEERGLSRLALYAFSMGGAAAMRAAPLMPNVRCVVTDSTFIDFPPLVEEQFESSPAPIRRAILGIVNFCSRLEIQTSLKDVSPRPFIARISPRPILIIHGDADRLIPLSQARALYAAAAEPKELFIVHGAGHCEEHAVATAQYEKRVAAFLRNAMK